MIVSWDAFKARVGLACPEDIEAPHTSGRNLCAVVSLAARHRVSSICEIGTGYGDTAAALAKYNPTAFVNTFDVYKGGGGYDPRSRFAQREVRAREEVGQACKGLPNANVHALTGDMIASSIVFDAPYDFIFIDADHRWRAIAAYTQLALKCAADNAVLVWAGYWYYSPEVGHYIDVLNERVGNLICHVIDTHICFTPLTKETKERFIAEAADL